MFEQYILLIKLKYSEKLNQLTRIVFKGFRKIYF